MTQNDPTPLVMIGGTHDGETMTVLYGSSARMPKRVPLPAYPAEPFDVMGALATNDETYHIEQFHAPDGTVRLLRHEGLTITDCLKRMLERYAERRR